MGEMAAAMAAASGSATPEYAPQVPEFSPDDLCRQLNEWKRAVEGELLNTGRHHRELRQTVVQANGSLMLVGQKVEDLTTGISEKMDAMTASGIAALKTTIEEFQLKIAQQEYFQSQNRSAIELVVHEAEAKFKAMEGASHLYQESVRADAKGMLDSFNAEVERSRGADEALKQRLQEL